MPGSEKPTFQLAEDELEYGMVIHGSRESNGPRCARPMN
ncbi:hypothetical protein [Enterocloster sp.]